MKKKLSISDLLIVLFLVLGLGLLLYPTVSNYVNSFSMTTTIKNYENIVERMDDSSIKEELDRAKQYNFDKSNSLGSALTKEEIEEYNSLLNVTGNGVMGYIEIPSLSIRLPIFHSTDDAVLAVGVGHLEWTSLPVGGSGTHSVLSGHRGLPSARLFTDISSLKEGDYFFIDILNERFTYEVDQIVTVLPQELSDLKIVEGKDYCTLLTCTPYGVNSHRLLVRGHRVENILDVVVIPDASRIDSTTIALVIIVPILVIIWLITYLRIGKRRKKWKDY